MNALTMRTPRVGVEAKALWVRECLAGSRLARTPWLLALAGIGTGFVVLLAGISSHAPSSDVGRSLFHVAFSIATLFVTLFGPALAANAIALEREGKTWEALIMAGVSPRAIDRGKFLGAYTHLGMYVIALLPALAIPQVFGGVRLAESLLALVMLLTVGALAVRFGLFLSATAPTGRTALLVTMAASCVLTLLVSTFDAVMAEILRHEVGMSALVSEGPVFWPVALVHERFGFDYVRYLIVIPVGGVVVVGSVLRALTLGAIEAAASLEPEAAVRRARARKRLALFLASAVLLGLVPGRDVTLLFVEGMFALGAGAAIVVVAGSPSRTATLRRSLGLLLTTSAGVFVVLLVTLLVEGKRDSIFLLGGTYDSLKSFLYYAPAFATFVTGVCALTRTLVRRGVLARAIAVVVIATAASAPLLVAVFLKVAGGESSSVIAVSPFGVLEARTAPVALVVAATAWGILGALLLMVTHLRERRSSRA